MHLTRQKKNTWLKRQRDMALFDTYRTALMEKYFTSQKEAVDYVRKSQAPRFYISAHAAVVYVNMLDAGKPLYGLNGSSLRRISEIYRRYLHMKGLPSYCGLSAFRICQMIVEQPAPEFYIGYELASKIIRKEAACHNDMMIRRMGL